MIIFDIANPINLNATFVNMEVAIESTFSTQITTLYNKIWYEQQLWGNSNKLFDLNIYYIVSTIFSLYSWEQYTIFEVNSFDEFIDKHNLSKVIEKLKCYGIDMFKLMKDYTEIEYESGFDSGGNSVEDLDTEIIEEEGK